jgi:hypothetical protein
MRFQFLFFVTHLFSKFSKPLRQTYCKELKKNIPSTPQRENSTFPLGDVEGEIAGRDEGEKK